MTILGWVQIALYCVLIAALVRPLGGYMTRVFAGERTFLSPVLAPVERGFYRLAGIDPRSEQHWLTYATAMLVFNAAGLVLLYALQRLQADLPLNPQSMAAVPVDLALNTATSWYPILPPTCTAPAANRPPSPKPTLRHVRTRA